MDPAPRFAPPDPDLSDGVVRLRRWRPADLQSVFVACQDEEIQRWVPIPVPYRMDDAQSLIEGAAAGWTTGMHGSLAISDAETEEMLGAIGLSPHRGRGASIGYWVAPEHRGRGNATRAVKLMSRWAMAELALVRLELYLFVGNDGSAKVAERAGFQREGVLRNFFILRGEPRDCVMYSLVPGDD